MQRWIPILAVILAVQLLLAGALTLRTDAVSASTPSSPLFTATLKDIDHVVIDGKFANDKSGKDNTSVDLVKQDGKWVLHNDFDAPANQGRVDELLGKLIDLKRGLPIATSKAALRRFKVSDDTYERRVTLSGNGKPLATLYFGDSPGVHKTDARSAKDGAVYAVDMPVYELPAKAQDWFDTGMLQHPTEQLAEVDISGKDLANVTLTHAAISTPDAKQGVTQTATPASTKASTSSRPETKPATQPVASWQVQNAGAGKKLDPAHVDELVRTINNLRVTDVLGKDAKPEWQMDHPLLQLTLKDEHGQARTWTLARSSAGDVKILKSSSHPWYFAISADTAKALLDNSNSNTLLVAANNDKSGNDKHGKRNEKNKALAADSHKKSGSAG
ncbi:MAG: DUF4340 domain-containing protein [Steroidobacter sp.]